MPDAYPDNEPTWAVYPESYNKLYIVANQQTFEFRDTEVDIDTTLGVKWDVKESAGVDGANEKYRGYSPGKATVTWLLYTLAHEFTWDDLFAAIAPKPGKTAPGVILVGHPLIQKVNLGRFRVDDISGPKKKGSGFLSVTLKLFEAFDAPKVSPKPQPPTAPSTAITDIPIAGALKPVKPAPPTPPSKGSGTAP